MTKYITTKDWKRMLDLVLCDEDGVSTSRLIKDKDKAISRFIAGLKLSDCPLCYNSDFSSFGNRAIQLGATKEEIEKIYNETEIPTEFIDKIKTLSTKKLSNRFVGCISKAILDLDVNIDYLPHNGYAITEMGKDYMSRNGRKWTIGYKTIINGDKQFFFDAITDEGDGPTIYVVHTSSDEIFSELFYKKFGKNMFIKSIKGIIENIKKSN